VGSVATLIRNGDDPTEAENNGGPKELVLDHGRYEIRWTADHTADRGSYHVAGNRVAFRFVDGTHDWLAARWTYANGRLRFTDVVSPEGLFLALFAGEAPWRRVR
jgi:hypothetical protein